MINRKRSIWGLLLILLGVLIAVDKLGLIQNVSLFRMVFSVALGLMAIRHIVKLEFFGFFLPLAIIGILYDSQLNITAITPWTIIFIALLFSAGLNIMFKERKKSIKGRFATENISGYDNGSFIKLDVLFTESIKYLSNENFKELELDCNFSGVKLYFEDVILENGRGILEIDSNFSGVELYLPKEWTVENRLETIFSGVNENGIYQRDGVNTLILEGGLNFSGVEIYYI